MNKLQSAEHLIKHNGSCTGTKPIQCHRCLIYNRSCSQTNLKERVKIAKKYVAMVTATKIRKANSIITNHGCCVNEICHECYEINVEACKLANNAERLIAAQKFLHKDDEIELITFGNTIFEMKDGKCNQCFYFSPKTDECRKSTRCALLNNQHYEKHNLDQYVTKDIDYSKLDAVTAYFLKKGKLVETANGFPSIDKLFSHKPLKRENKKVKSIQEVYIQLAHDGYIHTAAGHWKKEGEIQFSYEMFKYCNKAPGGGYGWKSEWLKQQ